MNVAAEFYSKEWDVEDVHGKESYDLVCRRRDEIKHIEVKGTKTDGAEVILTRKEGAARRGLPFLRAFRSQQSKWIGPKTEQSQPPAESTIPTIHGTSTRPL